MKKQYILKLIILLLLISCKYDIEKNTLLPKTKKESINFILCSDLSNRLTIHKKPIADTILISSFLNNYYPLIYRSGNRNNGQKDIIEVLLLNGMNVKNFNIDVDRLNIDFSKLTKLDRIKYLQGKKGNFKEDKLLFMQEVSKLYTVATSKPQGADIFNLFSSKLKLLDQDSTKRNILILFTDGYIEYGPRQSKGQKIYYLDQQLIENFRRKFNKTKDVTLQEFFDKNGYGIVPVKNAQLKNLEVLALEFHDRSLSKSGTAHKRPTDHEIKQLFWEDWMRRSKVKRFKSYEVFDNKKKFTESILEFIEYPSMYLTKSNYQ